MYTQSSVRQEPLEQADEAPERSLLIGARSLVVRLFGKTPRTSRIGELDAEALRALLPG
jgi:hypothetical protein